MSTNPVLGFFHTCGLFITGKVHFYKRDIGRSFLMRDHKAFTVFRHVKICSLKPDAEAVFVIRFKPADMSLEQNKRFSLLPMMIFMGFGGFREKYWMCNAESGYCQGIYAWQTAKDAERYSKSVAVTFMTKRSEQDSIQFQILNTSLEEYMGSLNAINQQ